VTSDAEGRFVVSAEKAPDGSNVYLIATGGAPVANPQGGANDAIAFLAALGTHPAAKVVVNEMTTIASVVTHAQLIDSAAIKGSPLALRIAAGNVPNFVDVATGGYGATIADALNGGQTPTLANFGTLANVLAGCATRVQAGACARVFAAATPPVGGAPTDTLTAVESIVRYPSHQPERLFAPPAGSICSTIRTSQTLQRVIFSSRRLGLRRRGRADLLGANQRGRRM
jgi:hypothetical protein